jgi:hypothetical protein
VTIAEPPAFMMIPYRAIPNLTQVATLSQRGSTRRRVGRSGVHAPRRRYFSRQHTEQLLGAVQYRFVIITPGYNLDLIDRGRAQSPESSGCEPNRMNPIVLMYRSRDLIYSTVYANTSSTLYVVHQRSSRRYLSYFTRVR